MDVLIIIGAALVVLYFVIAKVTAPVCNRCGGRKWMLVVPRPTCVSEWFTSSY
jgi:hypothetical protein